MKTIAIAAVTSGGKTTLVNEVKKKMSNVKSLHFDDYTFEGEVEDFREWVMNGADYNVWNLSPFMDDIKKIRDSGECDYLLLDYPFAYCHEAMSKYIDCAVFLDTPLDIALARRVLRDMKESTGDEIRHEMEVYLKFARVGYTQMLKDILPSSDHVIDGANDLETNVNELIRIMTE